VTLLEQQGEPIGALIHEPTALEDRALLREVAAAGRVALANVRLEAQLRRHVAELESSRRRIIDATDVERRRLQTLVGHRVGPALSDVGTLLDRGYEEAKASGSSAAGDELRAARDGLDAAKQEVERLAAGLHPVGPAEDGIRPALVALVDRVGLPVSVTVHSGRLAPAVERAIVFVCSEALTNVRKYAQASRVEIDVTVEGETVLVAVADDGIGGADPSAGSGLSGLRDRVEATGGVLSVDSPPGRGTRIVARIPLGLGL